VESWAVETFGLTYESTNQKSSEPRDAELENNLTQVFGREFSKDRVRKCCNTVYFLKIICLFRRMNVKNIDI